MELTITAEHYRRELDKVRALKQLTEDPNLDDETFSSYFLAIREEISLSGNPKLLTFLKNASMRYPYKNRVKSFLDQMEDHYKNHFTSKRSEELIARLGLHGITPRTE